MNQKEVQDLPDTNPSIEPRQHSSMDESFIYEKAIKKIYDEISGQFIENLKLQVEDQRRTISHLEKEIDDKNETIKNLQSRISELEMYINSQSVGNALEKYPFPISVAEDGSLRILMTK
jgi:predicted RNase H-like nuclease (RuvC/YqgF family)